MKHFNYGIHNTNVTYEIRLRQSHVFGLVVCGNGEGAIKQVAGIEGVIREDFFKSHPTFPSDLDIPVGSCEQLGCGGV